MADSLLAQIEKLNKVSGDPNGTQDGALGDLVLATDGSGPWVKTTSSGTLTGWVDVSATGGGGGGAVDSVNGATGVVVLDPDDLDDSATTNKFTTVADIEKLAEIEANATADQSDSEIETAYNNRVDQVSGGEKAAGTETSVRRFSPGDVKDMIDAHSSPGSGSTNITVVESPSGVEIQSSSGNNDTIQLADATNAGAYPPAHFNRISRALLPTQTLSSSASMAIDADTGLSYNLDISDTGATLAITNMLDSDVISIRCQQSVIGGSISTITVNGTTAPIQGSFSSGNNEINLIQIQLFGSNPVASVGA